MQIRYKNWIYDLETYPNCFTMAIVREDGKFPRVFECSTRMNEVEGIYKAIDFLEQDEASMVGFNNLGFDYPVLHELILLRGRKLSGAEIAKKMYSAAQKQIESMKATGFPKTIPLDEVVVRQIDLYKIHHFDNKAKATGLKMIEFNMRSDNIEDLPYAVGKVLEDEEIDNLKVYNLHDVEMTRLFYQDTKPMIVFREELTKKYNRNFMNHNDTKIGKDYFIMSLEQQGIKTTKFKDGKKVLNQTKRDKINLKDCIFDYYDFKRPEFIAILEWFKKQTITETKGVFSDLTEYELGDVAQYAEMEVKRLKFKTKPTDKELQEKRKENPKGWVEEEELKATEYLLDDSGAIVEDYPLDEFGNKDTTKKKKKVRVPKKSYYWCWNQVTTLNIVVDGFRFDLGVGGIHGSLTKKIIHENKNWGLVDLDVSSFYPNLAISNRIYPEHLSEKFCDIYQDVYEQRKSFPKGSTENAMMKLALNGVYGDSNNKFSPFYDPKYTMSICVNGQLSICYLIDMFYENNLKFKMIMANTDGITITVRRDQDSKMMQIVKQWEDRLKLQMERVDYESMYIRDCNNYIGKYKE